MASHRLLRLSAITIATALSLPSYTAAQAAPPKAHSREEIISAAKAIIQKARYCTFVTNGDNGHPQARIVDPLGPDENFTIWIGTNPLTRKVNEITRDARVTLSCFDTASSSYATLQGRAAVVTDAAERAQRWKDDWKPFYTTGAGGNDFILIRLTPIHLEIVSPDRGLAGDAKTWLPLSIEFDAMAQPTDEQMIRAARASSNAAIAAHDPAAMARYWMEDVHVLASTSAQTAGRTANQERMAAQFKNRPDTIYVRTPVTVEVFLPWAVASERGEWTGRWTEPDGVMSIGGTYQAQWRRVDGRWLIQGELFVPTHCSGSKYCNARP